MSLGIPNRLAFVLALVFCREPCTAGGPFPTSTMPAFDPAGAVLLENEHFRLEFRRDSGTLYRLLDKTAKTEIIAEPKLADIFRLCLPIPNTQSNYLFGKQQRITAVESQPNKLVLRWAGPLHNAQGEPFDLSAAMTIELRGPAVTFCLDVSNKTEHPLMEVWYPIIGGTHGFGERLDTLTYIPGKDGKTLASDLFWNTRSSNELGCPVAEALFLSPGALTATWIDLYNLKLKRGIYFGLRDQTARIKIMRFELQPGYSHLRTPDTWPRPEEIDPRYPVGMVCC